MRHPCQTVITAVFFVWNISYTGGVRSKDACPKTCPDVYEPVCGTDGQLYPHQCKLRRSNCYIIPPVTVANQGLCRHEWDIHISATNTYRSNANGSVFLAIYDYKGRITKPLSIGSPNMQKKNFTFVTLKLGKTKKVRVWITGAGKVYFDKIYIMQEGSGVWSVYRMRRWLGIGENKEIYMSTGLTAVSNASALQMSYNLKCDFTQNATICASNGIEYFNVCFLKAWNCRKGANIAIVNQGKCQGKKSIRATGAVEELNLVPLWMPAAAGVFCLLAFYKLLRKAQGLLQGYII